ncbi:MAG: radical SAM protein [Elusimicrobiota bacterium]
MSKNDIQLFSPPLNRAFCRPELGVPQLVAWLRRKGLRAGQKDLNAILRSEDLRRNGPWTGNPNRDYADPLKFWQPPLIEDRRVWNHGAERYEITDALAAARGTHPIYESLYKRHVRPCAREARMAGFSLFSVAQVVPALFFCRRLREDLPGKPLVFGGPWVSASWPVLPRWAGLFDLVDYAVGFSGESPLESLLKAGADAVPGLARRVRGRVLLTEPAAPIPLDEIPPPEFDDLDFSLYSERALPYQTTRGCEWGRCKFCFHVMPDNQPRSKRVEKVVSEIAALVRRHKPDVVDLADLSAPLDVMRGLAKGLLRKRVKVRWNALARSSPEYTPGTAALLRRSGCEALYIGLETVNAAELRRLDKGIRLEVLERNIRTLSAAGIGVFLFILNYPSQREEDLRQTMLFAAGYAEELKDFTAERFQLPRWMQRRGLPFGRRDPRSWRDLNSFNVPFFAKGVPMETFRKIENLKKAL